MGSDLGAFKPDPGEKEIRELSRKREGKSLKIEEEDSSGSVSDTWVEKRWRRRMV